MRLQFFKTTCLLASSMLALAACSDSDKTPSEETPMAAFAFSDSAPDQYSRIDRMGMPAVSTALIASKDAYNQSNPVDDSSGTYLTEIVNSLGSLHAALDDQLMSLELTPCTVAGDGSGSCATFAQPLLVPDTLKINTTADVGFPNGRLLTDPVIDVTLAVALLELTGDPAPHTAVDLVGILNPAANDREFMADFPFLATPN